MRNTIQAPNGASSRYLLALLGRLTTANGPKKRICKRVRPGDEVGESAVSDSTSPGSSPGRVSKHEPTSN